MKLICDMIGGSRSYGLETPNSDFDRRGVYLYDDPHYILGLKKDDVIDSRPAGKDDEVYFELRKYLNLLRKTNTMAMELLFNHNWIEITPAFELIQKNRESLIDTDYFYKSLKGYIQGETRLAFGERTGQLGGKRKEALDKYSFSPKNIVQLMRLCIAGTIFFQKGYFPVNIAKHAPNRLEILMHIKTQPEKYMGFQSELRKTIMDYELALDESYEKRQINLTFDDNLANDICVELYKGML